MDTTSVCRCCQLSHTCSYFSFATGSRLQSTGFVQPHHYGLSNDSTLVPLVLVVVDTWNMKANGERWSKSIPVRVLRGSRALAKCYMFRPIPSQSASPIALPSANGPSPPQTIQFACGTRRRSGLKCQVPGISLACGFNEREGGGKGYWHKPILTFYNAFK
jgi:hypothetical protein